MSFGQVYYVNVIMDVGVIWCIVVVVEDMDVVVLFGCGLGDVWSQIVGYVVWQFVNQVVWVCVYGIEVVENCSVQC